MKWQFPTLRTNLCAVAVIILLGGLGAAFLIYRSAKIDSETVLGNNLEGEQVDPNDPEISKMYLRDLERFGGKANVLADQFNRWFVGLWQGESLAFTIGWISIITSFSILLFAFRLSSGNQANEEIKNNWNRLE